MPFDVNKFRGDGDSLLLDELGAAGAQAVFTVSCLGASADGAGSAANGTYWTFSTDRHDYYVWYNVTGTASSGTVLSPSDPTPAGFVGIPVSIDVSNVQLASEVAEATVGALSRISEIALLASAASVGASTQFAVTIKEFGDVTDARASSTAAGDVSSSVIVALSITTSGVALHNIDAKHVIHASAGGIDSIIGQNGSVYNLEASTYRIVNINDGMQGGASSGTITAASAGDHVKSDNLVLTDSMRDAAGSSLGGVV
jgi:hypothetical protein